MNVQLRTGRATGGALPGDFREAFSNRVIPELLEFDPDLLFISAGFDGHIDDVIGETRLHVDDFEWVTRQLMNVANVCCEGRIVSVLEGG